MFKRRIGVGTYVVYFELQFIGEFRHFFEKHLCVVTRRTALLSGNKDGRFALGEEKQPYIAGQLFKNALDIGLNLGCQKTHVPSLLCSYYRMRQIRTQPALEFLPI